MIYCDERQPENWVFRLPKTNKKGKNMNQQQFATHALIAAGLQDELEEDEELTEDSLYGLFQCFMPDGAGVEAVFQPLSTGKALHERIQPIYAATESSARKALESDFAPAYFCPKRTADQAKLKRIGANYLDGIKDLARFIEHDELLRRLDAVSEIVVGKRPEREYDGLEEMLSETLSDWSWDNFIDDNVAILSEAYYSINCDYYLSYYLQYPNYKHKPERDFLHPYFDLFLHGYCASLSGNRLVIFP